MSNNNELVIKNISNMLDQADEKITKYLNIENNEELAKGIGIAEIASAIAPPFNTSNAECASIIKFALKDRTDIFTKNNRIYKESVSITEGKSYLPSAIKYYNDIKTDISTMIDEEFTKTNIKKLEIGELSEKIGIILDKKSYVVYHCIKKLVDEERKDLKIDMGRYGGLYKIET